MSEPEPLAIEGGQAYREHMLKKTNQIKQEDQAMLELSRPIEKAQALLPEEPEWDEITEKTANGAVAVTYRHPMNAAARAIHEAEQDELKIKRALENEAKRVRARAELDARRARREEVTPGGYAERSRLALEAQKINREETNRIYAEQARENRWSNGYEFAAFYDLPEAKVMAPEDEDEPWTDRARQIEHWNRVKKLKKREEWSVKNIGPPSYEVWKEGLFWHGRVVHSGITMMKWKRLRRDWAHYAGSRKLLKYIESYGEPEIDKFEANAW